MVKESKAHHFTIDARFQVVQEVGKLTIQRIQTVSDDIGFAFPQYKVIGLADKEGRLNAEFKLLERDLLSRIQYGGDHPEFDTPSQAYTIRLLQFHYRKLDSQRSRNLFVDKLTQVFRNAIRLADDEISSPTTWDYEIDPTLDHIIKRRRLLKEAQQWVEERRQELRVARLEGTITLQVKTLAYRLLWEAGGMPVEYPTLSREFAAFIAKKIIKKGGKASAGTVYNYLTTSAIESNLFINTERNYKEALAWIEQEWPHVNRSKLRALPHMVKGR
jgi:hypothetical protein